jgi:hypothetical protein
MALSPTSVILSHLDEREYLLVELLRNVRAFHLQIEILNGHLVLSNHQRLFLTLGLRKGAHTCRCFSPDWVLNVSLQHFFLIRLV